MCATVGAVQLDLVLATRLGDIHGAICTPYEVIGGLGVDAIAGDAQPHCDTMRGVVGCSLKVGNCLTDTVRDRNCVVLGRGRHDDHKLLTAVPRHDVFFSTRWTNVVSTV